jgi:hypothetical protein
VDLKNPINWNKYTYAADDPVDFNDRRGLMMDLVDDGGDGGEFDYWGFGADIGGLEGGGDFTGIGDKPGGGGSNYTTALDQDAASKGIGLGELSYSVLGMTNAY